jgi:hypothetical protein
MKMEMFFAGSRKYICATKMNTTRIHKSVDGRIEVVAIKNPTNTVSKWRCKLNGDIEYGEEYEKSFSANSGIFS